MIIKLQSPKKFNPLEKGLIVVFYTFKKDELHTGIVGHLIRTYSYILESSILYLLFEQIHNIYLSVKKGKYRKHIQKSMKMSIFILFLKVIIPSCLHMAFQYPVYCMCARS